MNLLKLMAMCGLLMPMLQAEAAPAKGSLYVGISPSKHTIQLPKKLNLEDIKSTNVGIALGYNITPHISIELSHDAGRDDDEAPEEKVWHYKRTALLAFAHDIAGPAYAKASAGFQRLEVNYKAPGESSKFHSSSPIIGVALGTNIKQFGAEISVMASEAEEVEFDGVKEDLDTIALVLTGLYRF